MKLFYILLLFTLLTVNLRAQYFQINDLSGTTGTYGTYNVTVSSVGCDNYSPAICGTLTGTGYWVGYPICGASTTASGGYIYTFSSPISSVKIYSQAINGGPYGASETLQMFINGSPYNLTAANMLSYNDCPGSWTGFSSTVGSCYLDAGVLYGPVCCDSVYNGGDFVVTPCGGGINSFEVFSNGILNGVVVFVFIDTTPVSCFSAISNTPCQGDSLFLTTIGGDSSHPYTWYGPGGFTSTIKNPVIPSATMADTGWYFVLNTISGTVDTAKTHVTILPTPVVNLTTNAPLCANLAGTLNLFCNPDSASETFSWTGPNSFSSTIENPSIIGFLPADTGLYKVVVNLNGCKDSGTIHAEITPPPAAPFITGDTIYCFGATFIPFTVTGVSGSSFLWYTTGTGGTASTIATVINTSIINTTVVYVSQTIGSCESPRDSITVRVLPSISPSFSFYLHRSCNGDTVFLNNTSVNSTSYVWNFEDGSTSSITNPIHIYANSFPFSNSFIGNITLTAYNSLGCFVIDSLPINTTHYLNANYVPVPDTLCVGQATNFANASIGGALSYNWNFGDGNFDNTQNPNHIYNTGGIFHTQLIIMDSIRCQDSISKNIYILTLNVNTFKDTLLCLIKPLLLTNTEYLNLPNIPVSYTYLWQQNAALNNDTVYEPFFNGVGIFVYTLTVTAQPYGCIATDTVRIHSVVGAPLTNLTANQTITYGSSIQLNADNELLYFWLPPDGSLSDANINNPIAKPTHSTIYTVYGYDNYGCLDSAMITIYIDSTMSEFIPTAFSPNGDGLNDVFRIKGLTYQHLVEFKIFNRWGQEVFTTTNKDQGWDGTFNGIPQDIGTYFYEIIVSRPNQDKNIVYKGDVTLIR